MRDEGQLGPKIVLKNDALSAADFTSPAWPAHVVWSGLRYCLTSPEDDKALMEKLFLTLA